MNAETQAIERSLLEEKMRIEQETNMAEEEKQKFFDELVAREAETERQYANGFSAICTVWE